MASPAHSRKPILHPHGKVRTDSLSRFRIARPPASPAKQSEKTCVVLARSPASAQSRQQGRGSPLASHPPHTLGSLGPRITGAAASSAQSASAGLRPWRPQQRGAPQGGIAGRACPGERRHQDAWPCAARAFER